MNVDVVFNKENNRKVSTSFLSSHQGNNRHVSEQVGLLGSAAHFAFKEMDESVMPLKRATLRDLG